MFNDYILYYTNILYSLSRLKILSIILLILIYLYPWTLVIGKGSEGTNCPTPSTQIRFEEPNKYILI